MKTSNSKTLRMVELALMIAIIFLMAYTPLGYIRLPGLSITFLTVPVAVGAIILGPAGGAICGLAFGLTSVMVGMTSGGMVSILFTINPVGTLFLCMVPRILEGFLCGIIFKLCKSKMKKGAFFVGSLSCPLMNTLFFMSSLVAIFYNTEYVQGFVTSLGVTNPFAFVVAFVGVQGLIEAVVCTIIATGVSKALSIALKVA